MLSAVLAKWYNRERILKVGGSIWKREEENVFNSGTWKSEA